MEPPASVPECSTWAHLKAIMAGINATELLATDAQDLIKEVLSIEAEVESDPYGMRFGKESY